MPIAGIILAGVLIGIVVVLSRSDSERRALPPGLPPTPGIPLPPADKPLPTKLPPVVVKPKAPQELPPLIKAALDAVRQGTAVPEMLSAAIEMARKLGLFATAEALAKALDKLMLERIPALVKAPDVSGSTIPLDNASGKKLWIIDVRGGTKMAIPNFSSVLVQFKALQAAIGGLKIDGRIGVKTLAAFVKKVKTLGFTKYPDSVENLAANAVKWSEVLKKHFSPGQVGRPFDVPERQWREFVARVNGDWDKLAPRVQEKLGSYIGQNIEGEEVTLSGIYGVVARAGIRGAEQWLKSEEDRKKYPNTTSAFRSTNGLF